MKIFHGALSLSATILLAGCEGAGHGSDVERWRLSDEAVVQIGVRAGESDYQLHEVVDLVRLSDGSVVVANAGTSEIRFYDPEGRHLFNRGGQGDAPGEFRELASVDVLPGDSLVVFDSGNRRMSFFDATGKVVRSWTVESPGKGLFPSRALSLEDGSVLVFYFRGHMPGDPGGVLRWSAPAVRYSSDGELLNEVTEVPGDEWYRWDEGNTLMFLPFGQKGHADVHGNHLYVGDAQDFEFRIYGPRGQQVDQIRIPREPTRVTSDDIRRYEAEDLQGLTDPSARARRERLHRDLMYPDLMPAYESLVIDESGKLWVEAYRPHSEGARRWSVIDSAAGLVAQIEMPLRFEPVWIEEDLVLGVLTDDLDVQHVRGYELVRWEDGA